jgi:protein-glutamine gamma-glutamyltransferase
VNFARAHKVAVYLVAWCAYLALVMSGELSDLVVAASILGIIASWWWEAPRVKVERWTRVWSALGLGVFAYSVFAFIAGGDLVLIGAELLLFLLVAKLFGRRASRDYQQVYILSFLMLVAATVLNSEVSFGIFFLGFVVASTWALILIHLRREMKDNFLVRHADGAASQPVQVARLLASRRIVGPAFFAGTGAISVVVFVGAVLLFLAVPRIGFGLFFAKSRGGVHLTGFSDGVRLGGHGLIKNDDTVVMRVEVGGEYRGRSAPYLHWRGAAFDRYAGGQWTRSAEAPDTRRRPHMRDGQLLHYLQYDTDRDPLIRSDVPWFADRMRRAVRQDIYLEPLGYDVLFGASMPIAFRVDAGARPPRFRDERNDEFRFPHSAGIKYTVYSLPDSPPPTELRAAHGELPPGYGVYLQVPDAIGRDVRNLAGDITRSARSDYEKVLAVESYLRENFTYTLEMASPGGREPLEFFLLERKKGHCEYFSSAMAILLRIAGVPTRNVNGFLGGEWNEYSDYIAVRAGDAHSWVEVYFRGVGWVTFDPTPAAEIDQMGRGGGGLLDRLGRLTDTLRFKWFKWVIEYDLERQLGFFRRIGDFFKGGASKALGARWRGLREWARAHRVAAGLTGGAFAAVVIAIVLVRRRRRGHGEGSDRAPRRRDRDPVSQTYLAALRTLGRRGFPRGTSATPREHARSLVGAGAPGAAALTELCELYYAAEWSGVPSDEPARQRAQLLSSQIQDALRNVKKRKR